MKTNFLKLSLLALVLFTASCSSDDDNNDDNVIPPVATQKVSDLYAPQSGGQGQPVSGDFTRFSFSENKIVTTDNWDIAFRGTSIIVNGGTKINVDDAGEPTRKGSGSVSAVGGTFASVTLFPAANTFVQDAAKVPAFPASGANIWYNYNDVTHIITAKAGKIYVVKTHDGKYAKFEILSYYKGAPATPAADSAPRYYTFNFAYQANSTTTF